MVGPENRPDQNGPQFPPPGYGPPAGYGSPSAGYPPPGPGDLGPSPYPAFGGPPPPPRRSGKRVVWIIVGVVIVLAVLLAGAREVLKGDSVTSGRDVSVATASPSRATTPT